MLIGGKKTGVVYEMTPVERVRLETLTTIVAGIEAAAQALIGEIIVREKLQKDGYTIQFDKLSHTFIRTKVE